MAERTLRVTVVGDARNLTRTFDEVERRSSKLGTAMGKLGGVMAGAFGAGAVVAGIKTTVGAARDLETQTNRVRASFGPAAGDIEAFASTAASQLGLSRKAALEAAAGFGLVCDSVGMTKGETATFSKDLTTLAATMAKATGRAPAEAIEALGDSFRGEFETLDQFGIKLSAGAVQQELVRMGADKLKGKQREQAEVMATLNLLHAKAEPLQKQAAANTGSAADQQAKLNAKFEDARAALGEKLLPVVTEFAEFMSDLPRIFDENKTAFTIVGGAIAAVTGLVLANAAATKVKLAWDTAAAVASKGFAAAQWLVNAALTANPIGLVIAAVALLVGGLVIAYNKSETFRRIVQGAWEGIKTAAQSSWEWIKGVLDKLGEGWAKMRRAFAVAAFQVASTWLTVVGTLVDGAAKALGWIPGLGPKLKDAAKAFNEFKDKVNSALDKIRDENVEVTATTSIRFSKSFTQKDWVAARHAAGRMASGGPVVGPGPRGVDSELRWLAPGEHVWTDREVTAAGGHAAMERWRKAVVAGAVPGLATGGPVARIGNLPAQLAQVPTVRHGIASLMGDWAGGILVGALKTLMATAIPHRAGSWRQATAYLERLGIPFDIISTFRPGARTRASGSVSYHALNRAVDLVGPNMRRIFDALVPTNPTELIYSRAPFYIAGGGQRRPIGLLHPITRADHFSHVHAAYDQGGMLPPGLSLAWNGTGRPEPVLPPGTPLGMTVNVNLAGAILFGGEREVAARLEPAMRTALRTALRREGKTTLAAQL